MATFHAMGTDVTVVTPSLTAAREAALTDAVARLFETYEQRFSRFRADSELTRLNGAAGAASVSADLLAALLRARTYGELTAGIFDASVGGALVAHGYDRSFAPGSLDRGALDRAAPADALPTARFRDVQLDVERAMVTLPRGLRLDLGGMIKGYACDRAAALLPTDAFVDAGGDAVMRGADVDGEGWIVDVEDPRDPARVLVSLRVSDCAVATSATNRRRWALGETTAHHLIDPRTMAPAETDVLQATVLAPSAELAEVWAKTALVLGGHAAREVIERARLRGVLLRRDGSVEHIGALEVVDVAA